VLLGVTGFASAQQPDEGPVVIGRRDRWKAIELDRISASLSFLGRYRRDEQTGGGGPDFTDTESLLRETFDLSTRSFIGHRNLLDLTADVSLGLEDNYLDSDVAGIENQHDSTFLYLYNVQGLILGKGPAPVTAYSLRNETNQDRQFGGSIDTTTTEHGVSVRTFAETAPTTIGYFHRDSDTDDQTGVGDSSIRQDNVSLNSQWSPTANQSLSLDYTYDDIHESQQTGPEVDFRRHDATLTHLLSFGPSERHSLRSNLEFDDQQGDYAFQQLRLNEILQLEHSDRLDSRYDLTISDGEVSGVSQQLYTGSAQVRHKLFQSLVSRARAGASRNTSGDDFTSDQVFGDAGLDYTKKVPYGQFDAGTTLVLNHTENSETTSAVPVSGEARTFRDPLPIVINRSNVEVNTIVVRNIAGTPVYTEGVDYTVRALTDRVEIFRVVGGSIADGQTVLLDYVIGPAPGSTIDTVANSVSARYGINEGWLAGLSLYVNYINVDQSVDSADPDIVADDVRALRYGAEYLIGPFTFGGEHEDRDSTVSPFVATRFWARYDQRLGPSSSLTANATYDDINFTDENNHVKLIRVDGQWRQRISAALSFRLWLIYRNEENEFAGDSQGFEQIGEINWRKRQTEVFFSFNNAYLDGDNVDTFTQGVNLGIRRWF
jgi:hypothetical protein